MTRAPVKALLATAAFSALLAGCATTIEAGPGYYSYDTRPAANRPTVIYTEPAVTTYREPMVVYGDRTVVRSEPVYVYRPGVSSFWYHDHGQ
jgi:type IV pilus biogenesis protein CpaD/CtpE